jgi:hypothetical protein
MSARNGVTWDAGLAASLSALSQVTITGRAYLEMFSDRHCPALDTATKNGFETTDPIEICKAYRDDLAGTAALDPDRKNRVEKLTGNSGMSFFDRDAGIRFKLAIGAEIAVEQRWNIFGILEGAFGGERALFTSEFSGPMGDTDFQLYLQLGTSYKF